MSIVIIIIIVITINPDGDYTARTTTHSES